jgi:hypothetical protein
MDIAISELINVMCNRDLYYDVWKMYRPEAYLLCRVFHKELYNDIPNVSVVNVTGKFTLRGIQTIHRLTP